MLVIVGLQGEGVAFVVEEQLQWGMVAFVAIQRELGVFVGEKEHVLSQSSNGSFGGAVPGSVSPPRGPATVSGERLRFWEAQVSSVSGVSVWHQTFVGQYDWVVPVEECISVVGAVFCPPIFSQVLAQTIQLLDRYHF
jgi:hypothetical protein